LAGGAALDEIVALVAAGRRFLCTAHAAPDGDALGSMMATALGLQRLGKEAVAWVTAPPPGALARLPFARTLAAAPPEGAFDAVLVHDCGDWRLVGEPFPPRERTGPVAVLDHHAAARPFGDLIYRCPEAAATGVLSARLLARLGVALDGEIGEAIFCALACDTGWFRYGNTDGEAMALAAKLVERGVEPARLARALEEEQPPERLVLLCRVLETLELHGEAPRRAALLVLTRAMLAESGAAREQADGFVNYARALAGVEVGALVSEEADGVRVSLRSKGGCDVAAIAQRFDGGGHRAAAGCSLPLPLAAAKQALLAALLEALAAPPRGGVS
jgi:phosphoesterase RecJ-like protein